MEQEKGSGDYTKIIKCPKCGEGVEVHASRSEMLKGLEEYECAKCRGVYDKFEGKTQDKDVETNVA